MGFFSGLRKKVKKFIPKEIRPFVPYLAAMVPGLQGFAGGMGLKSLAAQKALIAGGTKFLTDDEADLKDIGITAALAGAPDYIGGKAGSMAGEYASKGTDTNTFKFLKGVEAAAKPEGIMGTAKMIGGQAGIDYGIKAAELNKDALARYNEDLARQGINDKAGRRAAIRAIYEGTGTWDMDEVDGMLDTYGYRTGGRVGYEGGNLVDMEDVILASTKGKKSEEETYFDEEGGDISMTKAVKKNIFERDEDDDNKDNRDSDLSENIEMAIDGYNRLYPEIKPASIRPLTFQDGGSVDDRLMERVKELQDEGLDFASALAQAMKEDMAANKARGGIMGGIDVNMKEQIDTPRGDMMIDENIEVADSSLMDAYEIYKFDMMEQGLEPMSLEEFRDQAMAEGQMASADMDIPIQDLADEFEITFGRPANSLDELKDFYKQKYEFNGDVSMMEGSEGKMASMEAGQEATLEEIYIELLDSGMNPEDAAIKAKEIYNSMSSKSSSGRTMAAQGGLMNLGGKEMDLRGGGFVPMGAKERADDVPARLSKNEFVMTADAVRAAGGGSVQKGADLMYDQMKQLEAKA